MALRRVHPVLEVIPDMPTGACAVLVCNGDRALAGVPGAAAAASQDWLLQNSTLLDNARILHVDPFALVAHSRISSVVSSLPL